MADKKSKSTPDSSSDNIEELVTKISGETFTAWYQEKKFTQNIRNGTPYFNENTHIPDPSRHSPSRLVQCQRKIYYRNLNAPAERSPPEGLFWIGTQFEEDIAMPYLESLAAANQYVRNSIWVDYEVSTDAGTLRIKGETDPVFVNRDSEPLLLTEVKTTSNIESMDGPKRHHKAQIHAYLYGLSEKFDQQTIDAVLLYWDRTAFDLKAFHTEFDPYFWRDVVLAWAEEFTQYRIDEELPPADPLFGWECQYCAYRHRCGQSKMDYEDVDAVGFLPLFDAYPVEEVRKYLQAYQQRGAKLTPTLASRYPHLAEQYSVYQWNCRVCGKMVPWDEVQQDSSDRTSPLCPYCSAKYDEDVPLLGPSPKDQLQEENKGRTESTSGCGSITSAMNPQEKS